jgi:hypothetical protein
MTKIQGSGGLIGKRKIAILNIDSIWNNFFLGRERCQSACYNIFKMGLHVEFGCVRAKRKKQWLTAPSPFSPPFWSFEKKFFYVIFFIYRSLQIQSFNWFASNLTELWKIYAWRPSWFSPSFCFFCSNLFFLMTLTSNIYH